MKVSVSSSEFNPQDRLVVALDVGKEKLTCYSPFVRNGLPMVMVDEVENRSNAVRGAFLEYGKLAAKEGYRGVHILCEPTGGYEKNLLRIARELGFSTAYVNSESVAKLRVVRQNDTGKTDELDPRIIHLAGKDGRQLTVRCLPVPYEQLRVLNGIYEQEDKSCVTAKNCLHETLLQLFPDLRLSSAQLFSRCGEALIGAFGADPHAIVKAGWPAFAQRLKARCGLLRQKTLEGIWHAAQVNHLHVVGFEVAAVLRDRVRQLYADWQQHQARKEALKKQMRELYRSLPEYEQLRTIPNVQELLLARLIGETGPLADYANGRRLLRMAGLNLCERKSGKYKGQTKISKKGRSLLRKILFQITALCLVKPGGLYSGYYTRRKLAGAIGMKLTTAVMRKFLTAVLGIYRSAVPFQVERLCTSASAFQAA